MNYPGHGLKDHETETDPFTHEIQRVLCSEKSYGMGWHPGRRGQVFVEG